MEVLGVGIATDTGGPVVLLQERTHPWRIVPIWVGVAEAEAIDREYRAVHVPRPLTHHLIALVIRVSGRRLVRVRITALREELFHAELVLDHDNQTIDARASDAIALALHIGVPILAEDTLLDTTAVTVATTVRIPDAPDPDVDVGDPDDDRAHQLIQFRRFLDDVDPDDFRPR
jgi:hypothetical protein